MNRFVAAAAMAATLFATAANADDYPNRPIRVFTTSSAAGLVLDDQRLAETFTQRVVEHAHEDVAQAAGARGGEHADRTVGIVVGVCRRRE